MQNSVVQEDIDWQMDNSDILTPLYTWCLHCERVFLTRDWRRRRRKSGGFYAIKQGRCPNCGEWEECDSLSWQELREERKEYPLIPTIGLQYSLHGWSERITNPLENTPVHAPG